MLQSLTFVMGVPTNLQSSDPNACFYPAIVPFKKPPPHKLINHRAHPSSQETVTRKRREAQENRSGKFLRKVQESREDQNWQCRSDKVRLAGCLPTAFTNIWAAKQILQQDFIRRQKLWEEEQARYASQIPVALEDEEEVAGHPQVMAGTFATSIAVDFLHVGQAWIYRIWNAYKRRRISRTRQRQLDDGQLTPILKARDLLCIAPTMKPMSFSLKLWQPSKPTIVRTHKNCNQSTGILRWTSRWIDKPLGHAALSDVPIQWG